MKPPRGAVPIGIVAAHLLAATMLTPGYLTPDSVAVFAWLRSIVFDGDLLFFNEWNGFGLIRDGIPLFKEVTAVGALANHWWVGASMLSAPAYLAAHVAAAGSEVRNGFGGIYAHALAWTAVAFGTLASLIAWRLARRESIETRPALGALAAIWIGTPMFWYEYRHPLGTHLAGVLCVAVLVLLLHRMDREPGAAIDLLAGLWLGLAIVTRLQHVLLAPAVALHLARTRRPPRAWGLVAAGASFPLAAQGLAWWAVYGQPLGPLAAGSSPLGGGTWMVLRTNALDEALFSSFHGLFPWAPVALLALAGWALEIRRRTLAATLIVMFVGEWLANGLLDRYFWGGLSFGPRRFVDLAVPLMLGLAWFLRRTGRAGGVAAALAAAWTALLAIAAASRTLDLARDVSPAELVRAVLEIPGMNVGSALFANAAIVRAPLGWLGGAILAGAAGAAAWALARRDRSALLATAVLVAAGMTAAAAAVVPTWERAPQALRQFGIRLPAATEAGPLLDARGLLAEEARYRRRRGDHEGLAETEALLQRIDERLSELGASGQ